MRKDPTRRFRADPAVQNHTVRFAQVLNDNAVTGQQMELWDRRANVADEDGSHGRIRGGAGTFFDHRAHSRADGSAVVRVVNVRSYVAPHNIRASGPLG